MAEKLTGGKVAGEGSYLLTGGITDQQGKALTGLTVRAFDKDLLTADDALGSATTDVNGR